MQFMLEPKCYIILTRDVVQPAASNMKSGEKVMELLLNEEQNMPSLNLNWPPALVGMTLGEVSWEVWTVDWIDLSVPIPSSRQDCFWSRSTIFTMRACPLW
jgi:hypothetical protein